MLDFVEVPSQQLVLFHQIQQHRVVLLRRELSLSASCFDRGLCFHGFADYYTFYWVSTDSLLDALVQIGVYLLDPVLAVAGAV